MLKILNLTLSHWIKLVLLFVGSSLQFSARTAELRSPVTLSYLERRHQAQTLAATHQSTFHSFQFTNQIKGSGINFTHKIVDDAAKDYKAAHYDHGGAIAAADFDGDGLIDLYFTSQLGSNELWRNLGKGQFAAATLKAGVGLEDQISVGASFADIDNDGLPDLFVTTVRHGNHLFKNLGNGRFEDITLAAGLSYIGHSSGAVFFDFDNDGLLDLLVTNVGKYTTEQKGRGGYYIARDDAFSGHLFPERSERSLLYRNLGKGRFKEVSKNLNFHDEFWVGDATFTDLNNDGFPDLYLPNMQGDDHYYENQGGKGFLDRTATYFPKTPWGSTGVKFFDFNQDGLADLFVSDMHSDMTRQQTEEALGLRPDIEKKKSQAYCAMQWTEAYLQGSSNNIFGNAFYQNLGRGKFNEISDQIGVETYWPWGISSGDLNADGYDDLLITAGMGYPFRYAINSVLLNESGKRFFDAEFVLGIEPRAGGRLGKEFFTLDCSGNDRTNNLCQGKSGLIAIPGSLSSRSSVFLDLDNDGDLDVVIGEFNDAPQVLISNLSQRRELHFLKVQLQGTRSNRDGLGAKVLVQFGGRTLTQFHDGKSGYLAQSSLPLYFGLGDSKVIDFVEVYWPSGERQRVTAPTLNSLLKLTEPNLKP